MAGVEIHANALHTLLQRRFLRPIEGGSAASVVLVCALLASLAFRYLRIHIALGVVGAMLVALPVIAMLLMRVDIWLYVALPALALLGSGASTAVWGYARSLRRADELAEAVAEREAATATIVHDLKQPLAAISTMAQILRSRSGEGEGEVDPELANRILSQVENALADIDDLLVASPEREIPLDVREFNLAALARDLAAAQGLKSSVHDVEVVTEAETVSVEGDPRYLGRVLSNLVDNAIKYWPEGGTVRIEVEEMSGHAIVRVIDEGIGMDGQQQEHCFERYRRVLPRGVNIPGTGIGLYSVRRIVAAHGGRVQVISSPGVGSTFVVTLPQRHPEEEKAPEVPQR
jgi:signal transduction histidine kinase